jgi:hypothetical protein
MQPWKKIAGVVALLFSAAVARAAEYDATFVKEEDKKIYVKIEGRERAIPFDAGTLFTNERGVNLPAGVKNLVNFQILKITTKMKTDSDKKQIETAVLVRVINRPGD